MTQLSEGHGADHAYVTADDPHFRPSSRIFGPTYGLDHRLFDGDHLRPEVREAVMERLNSVLQPLLGSSWQDYIEVYLSGSEASEWTSPELEGNSDFDTLLGVDYDTLRGEQASTDPVQSMSNNEIDQVLNAALRAHYNADPWNAPFGGQWSLTGYVNPGSYDIQAIKPYAAYDITRDEWAVKPPHLPSWSLEQFPQGEALIQEGEAVSAYVRAILAMPEPYRTQQGAALYDYLHADRQRAFGPNGEGWYDSGNVLEKWLDAEGLWAQLVRLKHNAAEGSYDEGYEPQEWSNTPITVMPEDYEPVGKIASVHRDEYGLIWKDDHPPQGQDWRGNVAPHHEEMLKAWEKHPGAVGTGRARQEFRKLVSTAPEVEGPVFRGATVKGAHTWSKMVDRHQPGTEVRFPRHVSTSTEPEIANGFGRVTYEIPNSGARAIGNSLHEAVMPPGRYEIESAELRDGHARAPIDGKTVFKTQNLHVKLRPKPAEKMAVTGALDLYHRTTPEQAATIMREKRMTSKETHPAHPGGVAFFSTHPNGEATGYGEGMVHVRVPEHLAELDDEFPGGEQHYTVPVRHLKPEHFVTTAATREVDLTDSDADAEGSWMVAFVPPQRVVESLVQEDGEPPEQLHITLLYLGKTGRDLTAKQAEQLPTLVEQWAKTQPVLHASTQGAGTFVNGDSHPLWASVNIPRGTWAHNSLVDFLTGHGFKIAHSYGWIPHITLRYDKWHVRFLPKIEPMSWDIDEIWLCNGEHWRSFPLKKE